MTLNRHVTLLAYLRGEGLAWYLKFGLWVPAAVFFVGWLSGPRMSQEAVRSAGIGLAAASGGTLAIVVGLVTYQLSTLSIGDMRHFVHSNMARAGFEVMLAGIKWGVFMSIIWGIAAVLISVFPPDLRFHIGLIVFGASLSHLWAAVRAAFDFFDLKMAIAASVESAVDKDREPRERLSP